MRNTLFIAAAWLFVALGLENGVFPLLGESFGFLDWGEVNLVAAGVILAGCLRGEIQALVFGLICSLIAGSVPGPGYLGPTLVSYTVAAYTAAVVSRWFFLDRFGVRFFNLYGLLVLESLIRTSVHQLLWHGEGAQALWATNFVLALAVASFYKPIKRSLGERSMLAPAPRRRTLTRRR